MIEMTLSSKTQDSKFEPWRSEAEHATSRSRRLPTILTMTDCDVITHVKLLHTNCYHTQLFSAYIYLVENHNNNLYFFMVPMTPFWGSWLMDYYVYI